MARKQSPSEENSMLWSMSRAVLFIVGTSHGRCPPKKHGGRARVLLPDS